MQRGIGYCHATDKHRRQPRHRRQLAGAAHLHVNALDAGQHFLRRVLVRHGPARLAGLEAQFALQRQRVDLVDHAVDVIRQLVALAAHVLVKRYQFNSAPRKAGLRCHRKTPFFQCLQQFKVRAPLRPALRCRRDFAHAIGKKAQRALGGNRRVQLAHRAGSGVARVDKGFLPALALRFVEALKVGACHVDLAAHLQHRRRPGGQHQRNLLQGADVVRHIFAHLAIAARGGLHQHSVFIAQAHRQAVKFQFGHTVHRCAVCHRLRFRRQRLRRCAFTALPLALLGGQVRAQLLLELFCARGRHIGFGADGQHRHRMAHRCQAGHGRAAHALGGRIGRQQFGVLKLQRLQPLVGAVVFGVGHFGRVLHVVLVPPQAQLHTQRVHFVFDSCWRRTGVGWSLKKP